VCVCVSVLLLMLSLRAVNSSKVFICISINCITAATIYSSSSPAKIITPTMFSNFIISLFNAFSSSSSCCYVISFVFVCLFGRVKSIFVEKRKKTLTKFNNSSAFVCCCCCKWSLIIISYNSLFPFLQSVCVCVLCFAFMYIKFS